jgi:hypothetical protein
VGLAPGLHCCCLCKKTGLSAKIYVTLLRLALAISLYAIAGEAQEEGSTR